MSCVSRQVAVVGLQLLLAAAACSPKPEASSGGGTRSPAAVLVPPPLDTAQQVTASADTGADDRPRLVRLEREARALARTDGCATASACRTAPVGWRGCGGPRTYIVYCAATTDSVALFRKLRELEAAEKAYNAKSGLMSTCEFRMPPGTQLAGRSCRDRPGAPVQQVP